MSRKGGTGGGGLVHPKGANSMAMSGLICRKALVGTGRAISVLFGINGNKPSYLVGPPFLVFMARFSATPGWHFSRALMESSLIGGCYYRVTYMLKVTESSSGRSLKTNIPREPKVGYVLQLQRLKKTSGNAVGGKG